MYVGAERKPGAINTNPNTPFLSLSSIQNLCIFSKLNYSANTENKSNTHLFHSANLESPSVMGACASKFKDFKDDAPAPAVRDVKIVDEVPSAAVKLVEETGTKEAAVSLVEETVTKEEEEDGEGNARSLGNLLREVEGEKGLVDDVVKNDATPQENKNIKSPEPVADETEKAPATQDLNKADDVKPASENVQVKACDVKTEEEPLAETEKIETLEKCEEQQTGSDEEKKKIEENPIETTKLETPETKDVVEKKGNEENKLTENTKIKTPAKVEDDEQAVEPTKAENPVENKAAEIKTDENKPVSDPEDGEEKTKN